MTLLDTTYSALLSAAVAVDVERDAVARAARRARHQVTTATAEAGRPREPRMESPDSEAMTATCGASDGGLDLDTTTT